MPFNIVCDYDTMGSNLNRYSRHRRPIARAILAYCWPSVLSHILSHAARMSSDVRIRFFHPYSYVIEKRKTRGILIS